MERHNLFLLLLLSSTLSFAHQRTDSVELPIAKYLHNAKAAVSYTFDDGLLEHYTLVYPHLEKLGLKGTFWIIGRNIDIRKKVRDAEPMTWAQVKELGEHGHELASHSFSHTSFLRLTPEGMYREIEQNDSAIYANTGFHPRTLCFPGNAKTDSIVAYVEAHPSILAVRTRQQAVGGARTPDSLRIRQWLDGVVESGEWGVGMTHAIMKGYDAFPDSSVFWAHLAYAKQLSDAGILWVATFADVAAYCKGVSDTVTYLLPRKPKHVKHGKCRLKPYQSCDGTWCVDAPRGAKLYVR